MKNFFKRIYNFLISFFRKKQVVAPKPTLKKTEVVKIDPQVIYKYKKAIRNQNKRFATTKSFNGENFKNILIEAHPEAKHYLKLVARKKFLDIKKIRNRILRNKYGKVLKFNDWKLQRLYEFRKAI